MNNCLSKIEDIDKDLLGRLLDKAFFYKKKFDLGVRKENILDGKMVAMIFEKASLRTKVAFEIATEYLGGTAIYLSSQQILASGSNVQGRESVPDITRNLERFSDLILARVYRHETIREIMQHTNKPVVNALCDRHHPTQALADVMVLQWHKKRLDGLKVAYVGDGNNVATSLMQICALAGMQFVYAAPAGYRIDEAEVKVAQKLGGRDDVVEYLEDPFQAVKGADAVYTDTFVSMGQESERDAKLKVFAGYQVNEELFAAADQDALFMHCLPAHRGEEVTSAVMDHERSIIFDQAECRMHVAKAILTNYLMA